jgi:hypothetical protein
VVVLGVFGIVPHLVESIFGEPSRSLYETAVVISE